MRCVYDPGFVPVLVGNGVKPRVSQFSFGAVAIAASEGPLFARHVPNGARVCYFSHLVKPSSQPSTGYGVGGLGNLAQNLDVRAFPEAIDFKEAFGSEAAQGGA